MEPAGTFRKSPPEPTPAHTRTLRNLPEPASGTYTSTHTPELSGTCLRNLHQHTPELSGTFWNLSPEPAPQTYTCTHRSLSGLKTPLAYAVGEKLNPKWCRLLRRGKSNAASKPARFEYMGMGGIIKYGTTSVLSGWFLGPMYWLYDCHGFFLQKSPGIAITTSMFINFGSGRLDLFLGGHTVRSIQDMPMLEHNVRSHRKPMLMIYVRKKMGSISKFCEARARCDQTTFHSDTVHKTTCFWFALGNDWKFTLLVYALKIPEYLPKWYTTILLRTGKPFSDHLPPPFLIAYDCLRGHAH